MENKAVTLRTYSKGFRLIFFLAILFSIAGSYISVIGPDRIREITDLIAQGMMTKMNLEKISQLATYLAMLFAIGAVANYGASFIMATISQRLTQKLREGIGQKVNRMPLNYFDQHSQGDTLSRVTNDLDTLGQTLNQSMSTLVSSTTMLIGTLIMMFRTDLTLTIVSISTVVIGFAITIFLMGKSRNFFKKQQNHLAEINGHIEEMYTGHAIVRSYNAVDFAKETFRNINEKLATSIWKAQFLSGIAMPLMTFIGNFGYVLVCIFGATLVIEGKITMGVIVAFMMYIRMFSRPIQQLAQSSQALAQARAAMTRVFEFLNEEELENEDHKVRQLDHVEGLVEFDHVQFGYDPEEIIIHDFSAYAKPGKKIAIVGPTGAGKTTIVNLLMRFYEINSGEIRLDGKNTQGMKRSEIHEYFAMVLQDTWLFEGTVRENLLFNKKEVGEAEMIAACQAVGIDHFINTLPKGYDTILNEKVTLSVGQKQLLTIARALIKDAPLLILDEATSSVDTRTEVLIQEAMDKLMEGRTSFIIAHRLSTIRNADLILVLKDGNIIEQGNHDQLIAAQGFYADLYNSQFEAA
ncbi:ABC transporter ATP-binding protein [Facklamia miroungae]|uniref:ATP-binding cassette, subfamily B n=1 Tax=Facklamia miroungae TaxID=120956 RepID=A0A1G7PWC3_9LACT|nr:ABC transporter ATP-binding protein [Facklamia miroungae]NKZ28834.1 ABC transporter ATP-binding protein [Facklamia miroungae]SDF89899.1 ATP-binding cassette, subfamily B [Facklamia miroungae]